MTKLRWEYVTTFGHTIGSFEGHIERHPSDPVLPHDGDGDGEGWELVCMAVTDTHLYWSWRRRVPAKKQRKR